MENDAIKRNTLRQRLGSIQEEYKTVNKQIDTEIDNANRDRLQRKADSLFEEMQKIERDINDLDKSLGNDNSVTSTSFQLQVFNFEIVKVRVEKNDRGNPEIQLDKRPGQAKFFVEKLPFDVNLEMVEIPGGTFRMGASEKEKGSTEDERPRHQVTVQPFFMGKYAVTQEQWQKVADFLPRANRELNPHPSRFKGDKRPVECISWYDVKEFCLRLSKYTKKEYCLPSEAEWEYACRAGTSTPFHYGETITTQLANYDGNYTYGDGVKGEYRQKTTQGGSFPPNAFGLYDMHGNVWEWCGDTWHENYEGAPSDGNYWLSENDNRKLVCGGSWSSFPVNCRSAYRYRREPDNFSNFIGFRVVCVLSPRI
jgi:formylglycine-generating enzyme required for sulfatase activity